MMMLIVKPITATLTNDTQTFGRMDPYCKVYLGGQCQRTQICQDGGRNPSWNGYLQFNTNDSNLRVQVWDSDSVTDDLVGAGSVNLAQRISPNQPATDIWVDLFYNGGSAGRVLLNVGFGNNQQYGVGMNVNMGMMNMGMGMMPPQNQMYGQQYQQYPQQYPPNNGFGGGFNNNGWNQY